MDERKPGDVNTAAGAVAYLQTIAATEVARETTYVVPVPPSCRGRVTVTISEPEGLPAYARVSWLPDGEGTPRLGWCWCGAIPIADVDSLRKQIANSIDEMTPLLAAMRIPPPDLGKPN